MADSGVRFGSSRLLRDVLEALGGITLAARTAGLAADLAAGSAADIDGSVIPSGATGKLLAVTVASSAAARWQIKSRDGAAETTIDTLFTSGLGGQPAQLWRPPHQDFAQRAGDGLATSFRVSVLNLDPGQAADFYGTMYWDEE